jgi:hypothetical protein
MDPICWSYAACKGILPFPKICVNAFCLLQRGGKSAEKLYENFSLNTVEQRLSELVSDKGGSDNRKFG